MIVYINNKRQIAILSGCAVLIITLLSACHTDTQSLEDEDGVFCEDNENSHCEDSSVANSGQLSNLWLNDQEMQPSDSEEPDDSGKITDAIYAPGLELYRPEEGGLKPGLWYYEGGQQEKAEHTKLYQKQLFSFQKQTIYTVLSERVQQTQVISPMSLFLDTLYLSELSGCQNNKILSSLGLESSTEIADIIRSIEASGQYRTEKFVCETKRALLLNNETYITEKQRAISETGNCTVLQGDISAICKEYGRWIYETSEDQIRAQCSMENTTEMKLTSAFWYNCGWSWRFPASVWKEDEFKGPEGCSPCDMMTDSRTVNFYKKQMFSAALLPTQDFGIFVIFLPNEGIPVEELLEEEDFWNIMGSPYEQAEVITDRLDLRMPSFSISSAVNTREVLERIGLPDELFHVMGTDCDIQEVLSQCDISIAEMGISFKNEKKERKSNYYTSADAIQFTVNRPFIFAHILADGNIAFCGKVYDIQVPEYTGEAVAYP